MKHLGISGGGTKISGLFGAAKVIIQEKNYKPDVISGISAGAVLSLPLALGKFEEVESIVLNLELSTFFNVPPINKKGKIKLINAISKLLNGQHFLGEQFNLEKKLKEVISREEFDDYKNNPDLPHCIVGSVDFYTGKRLFINLKDVNYDLFPSMVNASASIPIFTPGIAVSGTLKDFEGKDHSGEMLLYDGGVRDHNPTSRILNSDEFTFTESASIYSRPKDNRILDNNCEPKNLLTILGRYTDITNIEISKNDELQEEAYFSSHNTFNHGTFFLPSIMQDVYDVDRQRLKELFEAGKNVVKDNWKDLPLA